MTRFMLPFMLALSLTGCASRLPPALTAPQPTATEIDQVRQIAGRIADSVTSALTIADGAGTLLDALPLATATKDQYDCALLKVTGTDSLSPTLTTVCGALPTMAAAPLTRARTALQGVSTCPSLRATTSALLLALEPLLTQLSLSGNSALVFAGSALRTTFTFARAFLEGGGECA